ncbi:MAG: hypothetical protein M9884_17375 [Rhodocyclaceae bacterium]|nr:hypothetical protein [Rhodocyclaceae bacterium]
MTIEDIQGFMETTHGIGSRELDLILHSPGGDLAAAEAIVSYLRSRFDHIRVFVPHAAMSAATLISCAANELILGKHSFLGPVDPQFVLPTPLGARMVPAHALLEQFDMAQQQCADPSKMGGWVPMLAQYGPDLLVQARNAISLSENLADAWLKKHLMVTDPSKATSVARWLSDHQSMKQHRRYLSRETLVGAGMPISALEDDQILQDLVLSVFHATTHTLDGTGVVKIIENHHSRAFLKVMRPPVGSTPPPQHPPAVQPSP